MVSLRRPTRPPERAPVGGEIMTEEKTTLSYPPPGPGVWELETAHYSRPVCRFTQGPTEEGFGAGFSEGTARYGVMLDRLEPRFVNDFVFVQPRPFGAPPGAKGPPPKLIFQLLMRVVPKIRARLRTSREAFEKKLWRDDLARWDESVRPASDKQHRALQSVDPASLSDEALVEHLLACKNQCRDMIKQHHRFTIGSCLPVGDFLAHVHEWTNKPPGEILQVLRGSSKISLGVAAQELDALAGAIRADAGARALLGGGEPAEAVVSRLRTHDGAVGEAMRAYLDVVGYRTLGYDVSSKSAIEMPSMLIGAIRAALAADRAADSGGDARVAKLRADVPKEHQTQFDALLEEARFINRLRDERGHYSDGWATGIARRALLEVGRRLLKQGKVDDIELAVDASFDELRALVLGKDGPSLAELKRRASWRSTRSVNDADIPQWLGAKPSGPPPVEWLPEHGRRTQRAIAAFMSGLFDEPVLQRTTVSVKGLPVSPGIYEGTARLVEAEEDFIRIEKGDVLVTRTTSPYFNVVLPLLGAIVTDRGGQLCHAAIVSREYGIPGVVGTREATKLVKDGARVRVDGSTGEVTVVA
jgi:phosphohistidine swiveling domain-containing protein